MLTTNILNEFQLIHESTMQTERKIEKLHNEEKILNMAMENVQGNQISQLEQTKSEMIEIHGRLEDITKSLFNFNSRLSSIGNILQINAEKIETEASIQK
jgi:hypothetical protein